MVGATGFDERTQQSLGVHNDALDSTGTFSQVTFSLVFGNAPFNFRTQAHRWAPSAKPSSIALCFPILPFRKQVPIHSQVHMNRDRSYALVRCGGELEV